MTITRRRTTFWLSARWFRRIMTMSLKVALRVPGITGEISTLNGPY
jgi:hypothetical protein